MEITPKFSLNEEVLYKLDDMVGIDTIESIKAIISNDMMINYIYKLLNHEEFYEKDIHKIQKVIGEASQPCLASPDYIKLLAFIRE